MTRFYEQADGRVLIVAADGHVVATLRPDDTLTTVPPEGMHVLARDLILVPRTVAETIDHLLCQAGETVGPDLAQQITGTRHALAPYLDRAA